MSLQRSTREGGRISLILAIVFPAMIAAAVALAYLGYDGAQNVVSIYQRNFTQTAASEAKELTDELATDMDAEVNRLFVQLGQALDDPAVAGAPSCKSDDSPLIEAFAIIHERARRDFACAWPGSRQQELRKMIEKNVRHFDWRNMPLSLLKYIHIDKDSLFVVTKHKSVEGPAYFLVAKLNVSYILSNWIDEQLRKLGRLYRVAPFDETGRAFGHLIFGGSSEPQLGERFLYDEPLGHQLYQFRLRLAPNELTRQEIENDVARQRLIRPLLVVLATIIMAFGMGIVMLSVITERRASRLKSDFIANVSHELKTPLSLIRMFGEMVSTGRHKGEEAAREYGGIITRESERLSHLIDNVLDFARLERGKASYVFAEGDVAPVLERALDVCRYRVEKERLKLRTRVERHLPLVHMDENALTLVIINLVDNAVKYGSDGGVVEIGLERSPGGVALSVRDFGPGIPSDEQVRIFERFYRAQSARDRNVRGSGIGLALVRHIAEAHGGYVSVESPVPPVQEGSAGSLFRVYLPSANELSSETRSSSEHATMKS